MIYGQDIKKEIIRFTAEEKDSVRNFNCGNEVINSYLKEEACDDPQTVTFIVKDMLDSLVVILYTILFSNIFWCNSHGFIYNLFHNLLDRNIFKR